MKKPIIKNWIKYWTSTIAVSGLLVMGACGDSKETAEVEDVNTQTEEPVRENVAETTQEAEAETEEMTQTAQEESNLEFERTSNTQSGSDDMNASSIRDMDAHIEEHKKANERIKEELTDANSQLQDGTTSDQQERSQYGQDGNINQNRGENQQEEQTEANSQLQDRNTPDQQERSQYGEDGNINQTRGENQNQEMETDQNLYDPQSNTNQGDSEDQTRQSGNMDQDQNNLNSDQPASAPGQQNNNSELNQEQQNQQNLQGNDQQTGAVEYDTDQQGNTEMEMKNAQDVPSGDTTPYQDQETQRSTDPTQQDAGLDNNVNQQDTANVYDRQSNKMAEESPDAYLIIMETYRTTVDEENQEKYDEVIEDYKARRESMKGEKNPATGAYVSPETDPMPSVGIDRLTEQIQDNIEYPQNAQAAEIEGTVFVNFVVDENGNITEAKAIDDVIVPASSTTAATTPLDPTKFSENEIEEAKKEMMEEAVKAVEKTSGQWIPGQHEMQNVKAEVQLPVVFDIQRIGAAATDDPVDATQE